MSKTLMRGMDLQVKSETMEVQKNLHMVGGEGETSYAVNSTFQKVMLSTVKPFLEKSISDLLCENIPKCLKIADLGCSSGPNSLLPTSDIVDAIHVFCQKLDISPCFEIQVFLNDLPGNDFNSVFNSIPSFYEKLKNEKGDMFNRCFIAGVPGSFHGRLFPSQALSFVHTSTALHWLSQVPQGIEDNKGNIGLSITSPESVCSAYLNQFQHDFFTFLRSRSKELLPGGRVVISLLGRRSIESYGPEYHYWELVGRSLHDMVIEGTVDKEDFDAFNVPFYCANDVELKEGIEKEGSFHIDAFETLDAYLDSYDKEKEFMFDKETRGRNGARITRAVAESLIVSHFGELIVDKLFDKYAEYVGEHLVNVENKVVYHILCLTKKRG